MPAGFPKFGIHELIPPSPPACSQGNGTNTWDQYRTMELRFKFDRGEQADNGEYCETDEA